MLESFQPKYTYHTVNNNKSPKRGDKIPKAGHPMNPKQAGSTGEALGVDNVPKGEDGFAKRDG